MSDTLADLSQARARRWRPPRQPRSLLEFARTLTLPDGPSAGTKFIPESEPTQLNLLRLIDSGKYRRIVLVWPSQRGKTLLGIILPWLHSVCEMRDSVGYLMPTLDKLSQNWEGKIKPAITGAGFEAWLPTKGPGSKGGRPAALPMRDPETGRVAARTYFMALGGGGKETSTSSVSPRVVCVDEADDAESAGQLELSFKRTASYGAHGRAYVVSTVNTGRARESHPILDLAATGTMSRVHHRCPHCGDMAPITRARLVGSSLTCTACSAVWSEDDAREALNRSEIRHGQESSGTLSLICVGPDFHLGGGLAEIVAQRDRADAAQATGDQTLMTLYLNKVWCEHHDTTIKDDQGQTTIPTRARLAALSTRSPYSLAVDRRDEDGDSVHLAEVPPWVTHQAMAVDAQRGGDRAPGRLYFLGLGRGGESKGCVTAWGSVLASPIGRQPTMAELHHALDRLDGLLRDWESPPIVARGIDVGDRQDELVPWIRAHRDWRAIKGSGPAKAQDGDLPGWLYRRIQPGGWTLSLIETLAALRQVHGEIVTEALLLPRDLPRESSLLRHLCATVEYEPGKWSQGAKDRPKHPEWQARDDLGQCSAYARALLYAWESRRPGAHHARPARKYGHIGSIL